MIKRRSLVFGGHDPDGEDYIPRLDDPIGAILRGRREQKDEGLDFHDDDSGGKGLSFGCLATGFIVMILVVSIMLGIAGSTLLILSREPRPLDSIESQATGLGSAVFALALAVFLAFLIVRGVRKSSLVGALGWFLLWLLVSLAGFGIFGVQVSYYNHLRSVCNPYFHFVMDSEGRQHFDTSWSPPSECPSDAFWLTGRHGPYTP